MTATKLEQAVSEEYRQWRLGVQRYALIYFSSRIALIIASAIVAADKNLEFSGTGGAILALVPVLSLLVAIIAALDTWLRPQERWRGFMRSRDSAQDLLLRMEQGLSDGDALAEFNKIRAEHRDRNVF